MPLPTIVDQSLMTVRMLMSLPRFLHPKASPESSRTVIERSLLNRAGGFLELVRHGIYGQPDSPYLPLLRRAGVDYDALARLIDHNGLEGALSRLYDAGVRVTLDEFKGRRPIRRDDLVVETHAASFDNPVQARHFEARTGGSRSSGGRLAVDLEQLAHDAHYDHVFMEMFGLQSRPWGLWHPGPPGAAGLKWALRLARMGHPVERWFSQTPILFSHDGRHAALMRAVNLASRLSGRVVPYPEHVPLSAAVTVARWLAECRSRGTPAAISTTASCAVRVCLAAREHGLDIRDTFIRASGEPLTAGKARVLREAGCVGRCHFAMSEIGRMGIACGHRSSDDDVHVVSDKVVFLQRDLDLPGGARVPALVLTSLRRSASKLMLNVELGDYAVMATGSCGCVWEDIGFTTRLHTIRSYEKLTSEGMHFAGADLIRLVEEVLPARFGGGPTDYQFVEEEEQGLTAVSLAVSPRLGVLDEGEIQKAVLSTLASPDRAHRMMSALWRDGGTIRIVRREPQATRAGKILTLHATQVAVG